MSDWLALENPPVNERIEVWTLRPDNSWMQVIGVMTPDETGEPLMQFDNVEHMEFHPEVPDAVAHFLGRMWRRL